MATGVLIVLIYIWSGESIVALLLSIFTLFAIAAIIEWKPWTIKTGTEVFAPLRQSRSSSNRSRGDWGGAGNGSPPIWRSRFDITWDERGVSGVALGKVAPQLWSWSQIDDISNAWCELDSFLQNSAGPTSVGPTSVDRTSAGPTSVDRNTADLDDAERVALCLDFPSLRNPEEPEQAQVMFGPTQHPDDIVSRLREAWRDSKVSQSRFYDLAPAERTRRFAENLGHPNGEGHAPQIQSARLASPELLYQELRRALLSSGRLCRVGFDADFDEVLERFDLLLDANDVERLSRSEAEELEAADGPNRLASLHWTLDWVAEQRGLRVAFVDQRGKADAEARDYLMGLIPAGTADDWDGQSIGSGSVKVVLDLPY